MSVCKFL